jgi:hypothetical protein
MRDLFDALGRHAAAAQHVFEKRTHIRRTLRSSESNQQDSVERPRVRH